VWGGNLGNGKGTLPPVARQKNQKIATAKKCNSWEESSEKYPKKKDRGGSATKEIAAKLKAVSGNKGTISR